MLASYGNTTALGHSIRIPDCCIQGNLIVADSDEVAVAHSHEVVMLGESVTGISQAG